MHVTTNKQSMLNTTYEDLMMDHKFSRFILLHVLCSILRGGNECAETSDYNF